MEPVGNQTIERLAQLAEEVKQIETTSKSSKMRVVDLHRILQFLCEQYHSY